MYRFNYNAVNMFFLSGLLITVLAESGQGSQSLRSNYYSFIIFIEQASRKKQTYCFHPLELIFFPFLCSFYNGLGIYLSIIVKA